MDFANIRGLLGNQDNIELEENDEELEAELQAIISGGVKPKTKNIASRNANTSHVSSNPVRSTDKSKSPAKRRSPTDYPIESALPSKLSTSRDISHSDIPKNVISNKSYEQLIDFDSPKTSLNKNDVNNKKIETTIKQSSSGSNEQNDLSKLTILRD